MASTTSTATTTRPKVTNAADIIDGRGDNVLSGRGGNDIIHGGGGNDTLNGGNGSDTLIGGAGTDTFAFDLTALTPARPGSGIVDHILDYNQGNSGIFNPAEGDTLDVSALLSAGSGQPVGNLVRVLQNSNGTAAILQIDQDGIGNGAQWTTIAQLDGVHSGDGVKVIFDTSQPAATLTVPHEFNGGPGNDTFSFNFNFTDATVSFSGNHVIVDGPSGSHTVLTGVETYVFTDGTVNNNDGNPLVDDLFYYSHNRDVWNAHVDADQHYHQSGWHEGRDPNSFFSTSFYLSLNQDVKTGGR